MPRKKSQNKPVEKAPETPKKTRVRKNIDDRIAAQQAKVDKYKDLLARQEAKLQHLNDKSSQISVNAMARQKREARKEIMKAIEESPLSMEQILEMIRNTGKPVEAENTSEA